MSDVLSVKASWEGRYRIIKSGRIPGNKPKRYQTKIVSLNNERLFNATTGEKKKIHRLATETSKRKFYSWLMVVPDEP